MTAIEITFIFDVSLLICELIVFFDKMIFEFELDKNFWNVVNYNIDFTALCDVALSIDDENVAIDFSLFVIFIDEQWWWFSLNFFLNA